MGIEIEGYNIGRAIAVADIPVAGIFARDTKSYFGVLDPDRCRAGHLSAFRENPRIGSPVRLMSGTGLEKKLLQQ